MVDTSVKRIRTLPERNRRLSPEEEARLSSIQEAVLQSDAQGLATLIRTLNPPAPYLQRQFCCAVARGSVTVSRCLLEAGVEIDGQIVFAACFKTKLTEMFKLLVEYGWNVNAYFGAGSSALGHEELVEWLLDHGANPNIGRKHMWNPSSEFSTESGQVLNLAAYASTVRVFDLLLKHGAKLEWSFALHQAAATEFTDERRKLMEHLIEDFHVDVNQKDDLMGPHRIGTPLFYAARSGNLEGTRLLLKHGADATVKNHWGVTAVDEAERFRSKELANLLRESLVISEMAKVQVGDHGRTT